MAACGFGDNRSRQTVNAACGDGVVDVGEGCDDGNRVGGDGCSDACAVETSAPVCGNGTREVGEACDDGNTTSGDGCSATCMVQSVCGNGTLEQGEACDDGNNASGDGCSPVCQVEQSTACGLVPQSGCMNGQACDLTASDDGTTACRAVTTAGTADSRCTMMTACAAGFSCVSDAEVASVAWCNRFCNVDADCGAGSKCANGLVDGNGMPLNVMVCSNSCSILAQTGCPTGVACYGVDSTGGDFTDCAVAGTKADNAACTYTTECLPGSLCVGNGAGQAFCREYCNMSNPTTCDAGETCVGFTSALLINGITHGACRPN